MFMKKIKDWLLVRDYDRAKKAATNKIVARQSRGNVLAQDGRGMSSKDLNNLALRSDKAIQSVAVKLERFAVAK